MWNVVLQTTFPEVRYFFCEPQVFLRPLHDQHQESDALSTLRDNLKLAAQETQLILAPLHCPESELHPMGHWTLLAIETKDHTNPAVRYYEGLDKMNEVCLDKAVKLCDLLNIPENLVQQTNHFRQIQDECTEVAMHYMEKEVRNLAGESFGAVKTLHPNQKRFQRLCLSRYCENLEKARMQWYDNEVQAVQKKKSLNKWIENKLGKDQVIQLDLLRFKQIADKTAEMSQKHQGLVGFDLPKPEPKPKSKAKPKAEIALPGSPSADVSGSFGEKPEQEEQSAQQSGCDPAAETTAKELQDLQDQVAKAEAESLKATDAEPTKEVKECDPQLIDEMQAMLDKTERKFSEWAQALTKEQRKMIVDNILEKSEHYNEIKTYLLYVGMHQVIRGCPKCRFGSGCEKCWLEKAEIYAIRHGKTPQWWIRKQKVHRGTM